MLDVSKLHQQPDDQPFPLLLQMVVVSALAIEERIFREHFQYCWILAAAPSDDFGSSLLLAIDDHQSIIGGDQAARKLLALGDTSLADGIPLSAAFAFDHSLFRRTADRDIPIRLMSARGDGRWWTALLTPPLSRSKVARSWAEAVVHSRARISTLGDLCENAERGDRERKTEGSSLRVNASSWFWFFLSCPPAVRGSRLSDSFPRAILETMDA